MRDRARVVVIGGGAVGASILYHLTQAGVGDCVLLEKDELTAGSTWHAAGNIPTYANSWLGMRAGNYAWSLYKDLAEKVERPITYRHTGAFWPAHSEERMDLFRHLVGLSKTAGFDLSLVTPADMEAKHPFYRAGIGVLGGILDPYEGDIDPSQLTQALAAGARKAGGDIQRFTCVTGLKQTPKGWQVETDKGRIEAEIVVNAAGFYGAQIAKMAGSALPIAVLEHQYLVTEPIAALAEQPALFPLLRDPDLGFYLRREGNALLFGSYGHAGRAAWPDGPPKDFAHQLFPDSVDDILEVLEAAIAHVPLLEEAGARRFVNGPIAYAPDGLPLVGPAFGLKNFYQATGVQIGITHSAAIGKAITEWITEGETEWDLSAWDPRRFGDWADATYARTRAVELYGLQYAIPYPHRILQSARPVQRTPLYERLKSEGAVMGQIGGWERAFWFQRPGVQEDGRLSFGHETWHDAVAAECKAVGQAVGIMDHGGFTKFEVSGPGAARYLDRLFCSALPRPGRVRLSYLLTPKGHLWSEATIARLSEDRFLLCGPTLADRQDFDWLHQALPNDGSVSLGQGYHRDAALLVMGPKSRALLSALTNADLSASAAPWMSLAEIVVAGIPVTALRVSYVGELGWELHLASQDLPTVYEALKAVGAPHGLQPFGSYALNAMRIEKGYHGWGSDFGSEYSPFDSGLERFLDFRKPDFIGRASAEVLRNCDADWTFRCFEIEGSDCDALPGDPVLLEDRPIGYVTSASFGFRCGKRLALGYIRTGTVALGQTVEMEIFGHRYPASCRMPGVYDPENRRLKS